MTQDTKEMLARIQRWSNRWKLCRKCELHLSTNTRPLYRGYKGKVTLPIDIIWIGESAGAVENALGKPIMGPAGVLLDSIIEKVIDATALKNHLVINTVVCTPPKDPNTGFIIKPTDDQVQTCFPHVSEICEITRPSIGVLLGKFSESTGSMLPIGSPKKLVSVYHPSYIVRLPEHEQIFEIAKIVAKIYEAYVKLLHDAKV